MGQNNSRPDATKQSAHNRWREVGSNLTRWVKADPASKDTIGDAPGSGNNVGKRFGKLSLLKGEEFYLVYPMLAQQLTQRPPLLACNLGRASDIAAALRH